MKKHVRAWKLKPLLLLKLRLTTIWLLTNKLGLKTLLQKNYYIHTAPNGQKGIDMALYGADAYLTKPFQKEKLMIRLEKLIQIRKNYKKNMHN